MALREIFWDSDAQQFLSRNIHGSYEIVSDGGGGLPYKVYTALLSQTTISQTSGVLIVGHKYQISHVVSGDDFSNVGWTNNREFTATATTPTTWTNGTVVYDNDASTIVGNVLENTIGDVIWFRVDIGDYEIRGEGLFPAAKIFCNLFGDFGGVQNPIQYIWNFSGHEAVGFYTTYVVGNDNAFAIEFKNTSGINVDLSDLMDTGSIAFEVRLYQ